MADQPGPRGSTPVTDDLRLPTHVVPRHYDIELAPDLHQHGFSGSVEIDVEILRPTSEIVCHSADLEISSAELTAAGSTVDMATALDPRAERLVLTSAHALEPGPARLSITFSGTLNDQLRGFYRSSFTDDDGVEHTIATTQFQSTDARRAFPCWDEPAYKATFRSSLVVEPHLLAVSNASEVGRDLLDDGRVRVRFAPTMVMSTYLVAFVVGPLEATEAIDVDGVPLRVVHRPGRGHQTGFALDVATHALRWLADYYDIAYPSDKVDLVAIPDFAFGAMENLGCVTFREVMLLIDPATASQPELQQVADVVNHELAHMWFGDLVTMRWWEGIWLNEAFATFMETSCSHAYRPDWKVWTSFGRARAAAYATDALASTRPIEYPVHSPDDAEDMFDVLTYEKGASVVRMLEQHLGPETFRDGVRLYLRRHAHANTDTADLWDAIEEVSGEPVRRMMDGWINQGGHPVITAEPGGDGVTIGQHHFTLDPAAADGRTWVVPVGLGVREGSEHRESRVLLETRTQTVEGAVDEVVSANLGAAGFYRVMPAAATIDSVASDGPGRMTVDERHALLDDAWALTVAGRLAASDLLRLISGFAGESDLTVWHAIVGGLTGVRHITRETSVPHLARRVLAVSDGAARGLGHDTRPGDDDRTRELRATLLRLRGIVAEAPDEIAAARDLLQHPDPTLASAALTVVARHGDAEDFARFRRVFEEATDPQTEQRHLKVLADFPDPELVLTILTGTLDGTVRSQDGPYLLRRALINPEAGATAWAFIADNWDELVARFPSNSAARMLEGIAALDEPQLAASIDDFLERHRLPHGTKQIAQHRERLAVNTVFRQRESARLSRWLAAHD